MAVHQQSLNELRAATLADVDPDIAELLGHELDRQRGQIELIASENFTWPAVLEAVGCVLATSANEPGGPSPASLDDVPARIRQACAAEVDVGPLPGTASTVIDFTRDEPYVIRDGLGDAADALERVRAALAS